MFTKLISTDEHYQAAMNRIDHIFDSPAGTLEDDELDLLLHLVEPYEPEPYPPLTTS